MIESLPLEYGYTEMLPDVFYTRLAPASVRAPETVLYNHALAAQLHPALAAPADKAALASFCAGNSLPENAQPFAQAYAGHQFGHFTMLGDGRAHVLGEVIDIEGRRRDIQYKGSGRTPYSRGGDGRAALGPMLREYIVSEGMYFLGVSTSRALAVAATGETVTRETDLPGAVLTRVAASHIRIGTFAYAAMRGREALQALADYTINRHFPDIAETGRPYTALLERVMRLQIDTVCEWMRVGFVHGVMNTDNAAVSGETLDYGPCAFMDAYDPATVFSSIDRAGRYAFAAQPGIAAWNLSRFAESLLPLLHDDINEAVTAADKALSAFPSRMKRAYGAMCRRKLGLPATAGEEADAAFGDILRLMRQYGADYTGVFRHIAEDRFPDTPLYKDKAFKEWRDTTLKDVRKRCGVNEGEARACMLAANPAVIPRNHLVEAALFAAEEQRDIAPAKALIAALRRPYSTDAPEKFRRPPPPGQVAYRTFCGT